jgi:hypothetical protein
VAQAQVPPVTAPFTIDLNVDLGEAQAQLQNTLNAIRRDDRCGDNWNVWDARVAPNGQSIRVDLHARYFRNECVIVRRPYVRRGEFRVRWRNEIIGETRLVSQSGHFAADVWPVFQGNTVSVDAKVVTADTGGLLGRLNLEGQIKPFLTGKIREALADRAKFPLPPGLTNANLTFTEVTFVDLGGGRLGMKIKATGKLTS